MSEEVVDNALLTLTAVVGQRRGAPVARGSNQEVLLADLQTHCIDLVQVDSGTGLGVHGRK
jgi:hypothetical protein